MRAKGWYLLCIFFLFLVPLVPIDRPNTGNSPPIDYSSVGIMEPANFKGSMLLSDPEPPLVSTISAYSPYNSSYQPRFIARTKAGDLYELTAEELNAYNATVRAQVWAVGIKTKFGIVAFYVNDEDTSRNHGQIILYPVFANGSLPAPTKPISATFMRLWMRVGSTWYQNYITDGELYSANGVDIRQLMVAYNHSGTLSLGWETTLTIQGFDFTVNNTLLIENTFLNTVQLKHKIIPLDRAFDGMGWEYVVSQSGYYKNTDWELMYGTATNETDRIQIKLSDYVDITQTVPGHYNRSTLLTAHNHTMHTFDWDSLKDTGFTNSLFRVENFLLPTGQLEYVLRVGMYAITNVPQNYSVVIDPIITITEDPVNTFPYSVARDSNNIPYVLAMIGTTLKIFKGNAEAPTSWSNVTVGDGNVASENAGDATLVIGQYSGTEYLWVFRENDSNELVMNNATISGFSFGADVTITATSSGIVSAAYDATTPRMVVTHAPDGKAYDLYHTTDFSSWTQVNVFDSDTVYARGGGVAFNGTNYHLAIGEDRNAYTKVWDSIDGLQHWNGAAWIASVSTDAGYGSHASYFGDLNFHGSASANMIAFSHAGYGADDTNIIFSRDDGVTWTPIDGMGYHEYAGYPSHTLLTNDSLLCYSSDWDTSLSDINTLFYNYTADSQESWVQFLDTGDINDDIQYFAGLLKEHDAWVDFSEQFYDATYATYYLNFTILQVGNPGGGGDTTAPSFSYVGTTNASTIELGTAISVNWSITEANPSKYIIYSNETGTGNVSRESGAYSNGEYVEWPFANTNASNIGLTLFFQVWANDTSTNSNSSIVYLNIVDTTAPVLVFDGTSTTNNSNIEYNSEDALANWSVTELDPAYFYVWCNGTGLNSTIDSGSYSNGVYLNYTYVNTNMSNVGKVVFIQAWANDTSGNSDTEIAYFSVVETGAPVLAYDGGSTINNSNLQFNVDNALANWSITEPNPAYYFVWTNSTGTNSTQASGSYTNGQYKSGTYTNTNVSNIDKTVFIQLWANDTEGNSATEIAYFTVIEEPPTWSYDGTSTTNTTSVEFGSTILANWSLADEDPNNFWIYSNSTGVNATKTSGTWSDGDYKAWSYQETTVNNIGKTVFIQLWIDDDGAYTNQSIAYFTIEDTTDPSLAYSGDTNNTNLEYGTDFTGEWTITELAPHYHYLWTNSTGINATKESGSYTNGGTLDWTYTNDNASNIGNVIFIQAWVNDTSSNTDTEIVYFTIIETVAPTFTYVGTTNNSQVHLGTNPVGNWSISEPNIPDKYLIWSNSTGTNSTKASGAYANGEYKSWTYTNDNETNADKTVFIQIYANDTQGNYNTSIAFFGIYNDIPSWNYTGSTNNTNVEWEIGGAFTASWNVSEGSPQWYFIYYNQSGSNTTYASSSYSDLELLTGTYNPVLADVGHVIYFQLWLNDTYGNSNSSIVYFSVTNTNAPTVTISSPGNTTYTGGAISITLVCNNEDLDMLWWALYFTNNTLIEGNVTWTMTVQRSLNDSSYYLKAYANDTAGLEDSEIVYFTLVTGAAVSGGGIATSYPETTTPPAAREPIPVPTILYRIPAALLVLGFCGGVYVIRRYLPEDGLAPEEEFQQFKREMRKDLLRTYYQATQKKKKPRKRSP